MSSTSARDASGSDFESGYRMMKTRGATHLVVVLSLLLATVPSRVLDSYQVADAVPGGATDSAPLSTSQLHALVAPIALYPDALVAQILSAATFPDQVAVADYWVQQHKELTGSSLAQAVNNETWNPSVKALTAFCRRHRAKIAWRAPRRKGCPGRTPRARGPG